MKKFVSLLLVVSILLLGGFAATAEEAKKWEGHSIVFAGWGDGAAALTALGGVVLYYAALYLFRERLERKIHFKIHKQ